MCHFTSLILILSRRITRFETSAHNFCIVCSTNFGRAKPLISSLVLPFYKSQMLYTILIAKNTYKTAKKTKNICDPAALVLLVLSNLWWMFS